MILGNTTPIPINTPRIAPGTVLKFPGVPSLDVLAPRPDSLTPHDILHIERAVVVHDPLSNRLAQCAGDLQTVVSAKFIKELNSCRIFLHRDQQPSGLLLLRRNGHCSFPPGSNQGRKPGSNQ